MYSFIANYKYRLVYIYKYMNQELELLTPTTGSKKVVFRLDADKIKDIKRIALEKETTLNDLFVEGVDCVLKKYKEFLK